MIADTLALAVMIFAFAAAVTAHLAIVVAFAIYGPRWRAPAALVFFPLAPYWALRERMWMRGIWWIGGVVVYFGVRLLLGD